MHVVVPLVAPVEILISLTANGRNAWLIIRRERRYEGRPAARGDDFAIWREDEGIFQRWMRAGARRLWPFLMECVQEFCTVQGFRF